MRIFKTDWFDRFAKKQNISDTTLLNAIERAESGQIDADLGSGLIKQRIARDGEGKRSGFRTIVLYRSNIHAFFVYGFSKSERDNIDRREKELFRKMAVHYLTLSDRELEILLAGEKLWEVSPDGENISK